ncbi:uncharacterized protein LOC111699990 [Eurytemora carolleeae]|uniref:uncharacterized protein LOC111699990 n=1 Tax=Eurytemora carolleeae TaxID=1294199 RepID=UPI000C77DF2E|nr:uncharacterized protein LOC111699990 [Eurytemora carolleeae]|eukprot:XP_023326563.1 uncharacterized protein LOC111699990 [Eurytemora affinis]
MSLHCYQNRLRLGRSLSPAPVYSSLYSSSFIPRYRSQSQMNRVYTTDSYPSNYRSSDYRSSTMPRSTLIWSNSGNTRSHMYSSMYSQDMPKHYSRYSDPPRSLTFFRYHSSTPIRYSTYPRFHSRFYR